MHREKAAFVPGSRRRFSKSGIPYRRPEMTQSSPQSPGLEVPDNDRGIEGDQDRQIFDGDILHKALQDSLCGLKATRPLPLNRFRNVQFYPTPRPAEKGPNLGNLLRVARRINQARLNLSLLQKSGKGDLPKALIMIPSFPSSLHHTSFCLPCE